MWIKQVRMRDTRVDEEHIWRSSYDIKPWTKPHKPWSIDASQSDLKGELRQEVNEEWNSSKDR